MSLPKLIGCLQRRLTRSESAKQKSLDNLAKSEDKVETKEESKEQSKEAPQEESRVEAAPDANGSTAVTDTVSSCPWAASGILFIS